VLVTQELVTAERIGGRQGHKQRDHHVDGHVDHRIDVTVVPAGIRKDHGIVIQGEILGPEGKPPENFLIGLERHVQQPVDRSQEQQNKQRNPDVF